MIGSLLDTMLDRTVLAGYTTAGYRIRRHMWDADDLRPKDGKTVRAAVLEATGNRDVRVCLCEVSDLRDVRAFAARFSADQSRLDVLVNNAGVLVINVSSGEMYTQRLHVQDLQSTVGKFDGPTVYARTKRAQVVLTELWARRLAGTGVVVHATPGVSAQPGCIESSLPAFSG